MLNVFFGCDGVTRRVVTIDLNQNKPVTAGLNFKTDNLKNFLLSVEKVTSKNGLTNIGYNETGKYYNYKRYSLNLYVYVKDEKFIQMELVEFGPIGKTKSFEMLEISLNEMLEHQFPGKNLMFVRKY
jgi:hypothetical protein